MKTVEVTAETISKTILPALIKGISQKDVAKKANCSQPTISRINAKLKETIESHQRKIATEAADYAVQDTILTQYRSNQVLNDLSISNKDLSDYQTLLTLAQKDRHAIFQNTGIFQSHTGPATYIQNINNPGLIIDPPEFKRFAEIIHARQETDVLDAEYTEEMSSFDEDS